MITKLQSVSLYPEDKSYIRSTYGYAKYASLYDFSSMMLEDYESLFDAIALHDVK